MQRHLIIVICILDVNIVPVFQLRSAIRWVGLLFTHEYSYFFILYSRFKVRRKQDRRDYGVYEKPNWLLYDSQARLPV